MTFSNHSTECFHCLMSNCENVNSSLLELRSYCPLDCFHFCTCICHFCIRYSSSLHKPFQHVPHRSRSPWLVHTVLLSRFSQQDICSGLLNSQMYFCIYTFLRCIEQIQYSHRLGVEIFLRNYFQFGLEHSSSYSRLESCRLHR